MTRLKAIAAAALGVFLMLAALGLFASVGVVVLGGLVCLGVCAAAAAWISNAKHAPEDT